MDSPRFLVDAMLGNVARKLRILGYDAAYDPERGTAAALADARASGRVLVTRSKRAAGAPDAIAVPPHCEPEAMKRIVRTAGLAVRISGDTARCPACNGQTTTADPRGLAERVPPGVRARNERFWECGSCRSVYWEGTHMRNMREAARSWT